MRWKPPAIFAFKGGLMPKKIIKTSKNVLYFKGVIEDDVGKFSHERKLI